MLFREKTKLAAPGDDSGLAHFSVLKSLRARVFPGIRKQNRPKAGSLAQDFGTPDCSPELQGPINTLKSIRRKILTSTFLNISTAWAAWILIGLIVAGSLSAKLGGWTVFAALLAGIGIVGILAWTVRTRLSIYETACHFDVAASLQDRVSTAIYLGDVRNPGGLVQHQRMDAVTRLAKVDPSGLFPVHMPAAARRALVLILIVAGLFVYRIHHKPPLVALLQTTARSSLVQSIFSPLVHAMERDLQRTMALAGIKPEPQADEVRAGEAMPTGDDLWPTGDEKNVAKADAQQASSDANDREAQDEMQQPGDQEGLPSADSQQQEGSEETQEGKNGNDNDGNAPTPADAQGSQSERQSLAQSMMQALKNMMNPTKSKNNTDRKSQPPDNQGAQQSGDSHQPGTAESDRNQQSRGNSDAEEKQSQTSSNGAGSQQGSKEFRKDQTEKHSGTATPDRVALEASGFKEQTRMRTETETGTARLAVHDGSTQTQAVINGAEQENIPARYRLYVQHYFEHADTDKQ